MSAMLEPEQDTVLALQLMGMRKTASDEEFAAVLSKLLGTCRMEGFRISLQALKIILDESVKKGVDQLDEKIIKAPNVREIRNAIQKAELPRQIRPMRTREEALQAHREKHPEMYNADGTRKSTDYDPSKLGRQELHGKIETDEELERATRPDPPRRAGYQHVGPTGKARKIDDAGREDIRNRSKQARLDGQGRYPKGWIKRLANEFDVSEALIYQIIYSDPSYTAIPKP